MPRSRSDLLKLLVKFVLLGFVCYFMTAWFFLRKREIPAFLPAFHSTKSIKNLFLYDGISLFQNKSCSCQNMKDMKGMQVYQLQDNFSPDEIKFVQERRMMELSHFQSRYVSKYQNILLAVPDCPLSYPIHGVKVMPLHTVLIPVTLKLGSHEVQFPVVIQQPSIAKLYDPGADKKISSVVTICTKTFLRYHKLRILIKSIRQYYPSITIIVADDSETPENVQEPNVEQYFMPFGKGWFAGRNLAVSQVTTKYFLWIDDDFLFNEKTKIEKMVDVLEKTNLDVVGGGVNGNFFSFKLLLEEGGEDGDCLHWRSGSYHPLEGFPNCVVTGGVVNFFLAHTEKVRSVGFDPKHQRVAHTEFFIDGLGTLLVGSCRDVSVSHQKKGKPSDPKAADMQKTYDTFRTERQDQVRHKLALLYFKNHLKCFTRT
ncbi:beta-1,4 N-acetylgalactosaminyltransferase 2 isoform X2 [Microcaecilia unicolor]|uniref:Beta-1,4 N-acetylgalactosaminyltransferase 2 isoform X2 n=1 Tax=Microcaecilia unicolor TaxID=1415580 RepID=A0A6P7ZGS7_9AMPH|nr:beta-1,4 N-acetylgalactosaminyltransferase 2 isoform X2 [Microcaecilia unicolor]